MPSKSVLIAQAFSKTGVLSTVVDSAPSVNTGQVDVATAAELPNTGNTEGDFAFVQATNRLYIWSGSGWYNIALINATPTWDSNGQPASSYELDADSPQTATTITLAASDPEGIPIQYSYVTGGSMDSIATVSQDSSVFTITPKNETQAPDGGTGSITFRATDGVNILPQVSSFTLNFISTIDDSKYTTLLATATGTSDNNNITDASSNSHSITVNGDAYAGTFSPYRSGGYSLKFNGTANNYIRAPWWQRANLGTNDFTVECFVYPTNSFSVICDLLPGSAGLFRLATWPGGNLALDINKQGVGAFDIRTTGGNINYNAWNHVAVCRSGTSLKLYSNGSLIHTETGGDWDYGTGDAYSNIGRWNTSGDVLNGYISNFRVKNSALYTGNTYNVPTEDFTSDSGTTLLIGAGALIDNVTPYGIEMYGVVTSEPFSPYDYTEYSATDHGGSVYFVGGADYSSQYLSLSGPSMPSGDFTLSTWAYLTHTVADNKTLIDFNGNSDGFRINYMSNSNGGYHFRFYTAGGTVYLYDQNIDHHLNQWNYIVVVRDSGTFKLYVNSKLINTSTVTPTFSSSTNVRIGQQLGGSGTLEGYLSDIIYNPTTAITDFTPPTAPLSSSGAELHIKGTDASIIDKSQGTNLKLVGNTTGSTTQVKFVGSKSMYFDGSSDRIEIDGPINLGTNPFTYEAWVYTTSNTWIFMTIGNHDGSSSHATAGSIIEYANNNFYMYKAEGGSITGNAATGYPSGSSGPGTVHNQGWKHVAFCRQSNGNHDLYSDGTRIMNYTGWNSQDYGSLDKILIGDYFSQSKPDFSGYLQDVRLTIGTSRYTGSTYTVPTEAFKG